MAEFKKTAKMLEAEEKYQQPVETFLPRLIDQKGKKGAMEDIGISKVTLNTWMLKLGLETQRRVVSVGDSSAASYDG